MCFAEMLERRPPRRVGLHVPHRKQLCLEDVPYCQAHLAKRQRIARLSNKAFDNPEPFNVQVEMPLAPKANFVEHASALRPLSLVPILRKQLGGTLLDANEHVLEDVDCWQFAYKSLFCVSDLLLLLVLVCQKAREWRLP